jgi:Tol biopolymer transport system component
MVKMYSLLISFGHDSGHAEPDPAKGFRQPYGALTAACHAVPMLRRLPLLLLALAPVSIASAAGPAPLVLVTFSTAQGTDLVVQQLDGTGRVSLTGGVSFASSPVWSPDGARVAFSTTRDTNGADPGEIYVIDADGSDLHALTHDAPPGHSRFKPVWSPDGSELAYLERNSATDPASADVWTVPASGGAARRLTSDAGDKRGIAWQPHGSLIAFDRAEAAGVWGLWTVDTASGAERRIGNIEGFGAAGSGFWSPDGTRLAFPDGQAHLIVASADGTGLHQLTAMRLDGAPAWSPGGDSLAFAAIRILDGPADRYGPPTATDIFVADAATGAARRLTGSFDPEIQGARGLSPSWWPDGSRLFFESDDFRADGPRELNADGTCERPEPSGLAGSIGAPRFQPGRPFDVGPDHCADLRIRASVVRQDVAPRQDAGVQVVVENHGNLPATDLNVTITGVGAAAAQLFGDTTGTLAPGEARTISGTLASPQVGVATALVAATASESDPTPADARQNVATSVLNCTLVGTAAADNLIGTPHNDRICGLPGPDRIEAGKGDDYIDAGNGNDTIVAGPGRDTIIARGGRDVIEARDGQLDWIDCGTEYDIAIVDRIDHVHHCEKVVRR